MHNVAVQAVGRSQLTQRGTHRKLHLVGAVASQINASKSAAIVSNLKSKNHTVAQRVYKPRCQWTT